MKSATVLFLVVCGLAGCSRDAASPSDPLTAIGEAEQLVLASSMAGDGSKLLPQLNRLPQNLQLTSEQQARIKALTDAFVLATKADQEALAAITKQIRDALATGQSKDKIRSLLDQAKAIGDRLVAAETKLRDDMLAVLTAEQKAWLASNQPAPCPLTDAQQSQISALLAGYEQANRADLDAVNAALARAKAAQKAGATREQINAILDTVKPALERIRLANEALQKAIQGVLTDAQLASHCVVQPVTRTK
jgi:Spy/CpxP family protein refolding chaperone